MEQETPKVNKRSVVLPFPAPGTLDGDLFAEEVAALGEALAHAAPKAGELWPWTRRAGDRAGGRGIGHNPPDRDVWWSERSGFSS